MATFTWTTAVRAAAFDALAETYDELFTNSRIGRARRFPQVFRLIVKADPWFSRCPLVRGWADHVLLTFERLAA